MTDPHPDLTRAYLAAATRAAERPDDLGFAAEAIRLGALLDAEGERDARAVEDRLNAPGALGKAAEFYADHGFPVFPLHPGEKTPATRHGLNDATTDLNVGPAWWARFPDANIGIRTGRVEDGGCEFDVIDLDGAPGVRSWYGDGYADADDAPVVLARSRTTRPGGWHLWTPATGRGNRAGMLPGVDYRGAGGFVVAPPSRRVLDGELRRWTWIDVPARLTSSGSAA